MTSLRALLTGLSIALACLAPARVHGAYDPSEPIAPIQAPFPMPQLQRPVFAQRVVSIAEFGAVSGGVVKNTTAIAATIAKVAEAGGGRVLVPAGRWLTGPIHLRSNIDLHLAEGAVLVFSDVFEDYLPPVFVRSGGVELYNYSPLIYARGCENIAITGPGFLDGNSRAWWPWKSLETREGFAMGAKGLPVEQRVFGTTQAAIRPSFLSLIDCKNVLMEGFTIGSGPNWTIHPVYCENIIIRRVNVITDGPNNDGIDPDSCRNMLIEYCNISTGDDCVVLKSGYDQDGRRVARPTENVVMRYTTSKRGHGGLVVGSEMSGSVRNVYMHNCDFEGTDRVLRIKSRPGRGGVVENIWVEDVTARDLQREVVILNMDYSSDRNAVVDTNPPLFRNIHVRRVAVAGVPVAIRITGMESSLIEKVDFEDMAIVATEGVIATHAKEISFKNVAISHSKGDLFQLKNVRGLSVNGVPLPETAAGKH